MTPYARCWLLMILILVFGFATTPSVFAQEPTHPDKSTAPDNPGEPPPPAPEPPRPANSHSFSDFMPFGIPDDGYIGTLDGNDGFGTDAGMACSTINTATVLPAGRAVYNTTVNVNINHTWIGDLTIKLRSPGGTILTLLNRPGSTAPDNGADSPIGDSSNWSSSLITFGDGTGPEAETMGGSLSDTQSICTNDGVCAHDPSPDTAVQPPSTFGNFRTTDATGVWTLCVGDSAQLDTGVMNQWQLHLTAADPYAASPGIGIPDDGYVGGFGGVGQACSTINTTSPAPVSATVLGVFTGVALSHTWVGDLTMKLRSPNNTTLTILNRPGSNAPDDGSGAVGNNANWNNTLIAFGDGFGPEAETMGTGLATDQVICTANGVCAHDPSPDTATQPPSAFSAYNGSSALGNWTLCMGDSALGDVGILNQWRLYLVRPVISLAVTLESMRAEAGADRVRVVWETASEIDNLGFHLYRSTDAAFIGERLTTELIPSAAPGSGQGAIYEWVDTTAVAGVTYYYTLEDLDVNGVGTPHPAVSNTPDVPTAVMLDQISTYQGIGYEWVTFIGLGVLVAGLVARRWWRRG